MAKNKILLRGGIWNDQDWPAYEAWVKENVFHSSNPKLGIKCGDKLNDEEASKAAIQIYLSRQQRTNKSMPKMTENDVYTIVSEDTGYSS